MDSQLLKDQQQAQVLHGQGQVLRTSQQLPIHQQQQGIHATSAGMKGREQKDQLMDQAEHTANVVKQKGEQLYDTVCDACNNWRHYPKLLTGLLLMTTFLVGAGSLASVQRLGMIGSGNQNYVSQHWSRETADAHHALDVVLDHLQNPMSYQTEKGETYVNKARNSLMGLFNFGGKKSKSSSRDYVERKGRDMYDDTRDVGRNLYDKAGDIKDDIAYKTRRGVDSVKDNAYGITHNIGSKISDIASGVKNTFVGGRDSDDDDYYRKSRRSSSSSILPSWLGGSDDDNDRSSSSSWLSSPSRGQRNRKDDYMRRGDNDEEELEQAADKLRHVVRSAERDNQ